MCQKDSSETIFGGLLLPFLKRKEAQPTGIIIKTRAPDGAKADESADNSDYGIESCAGDLLRALENKDVKGIAEALESAHEVLMNKPEVQEEE